MSKRARDPKRLFQGASCRLLRSVGLEIAPRAASVFGDGLVDQLLVQADRACEASATRWLTDRRCYRVVDYVCREALAAQLELAELPALALRLRAAPRVHSRATVLLMRALLQEIVANVSDRAGVDGWRDTPVGSPALLLAHEYSGIAKKLASSTHQPDTIASYSMAVFFDAGRYDSKTFVTPYSLRSVGIEPLFALYEELCLMSESDDRADKSRCAECHNCGTVFTERAWRWLRADGMGDARKCVCGESLAREEAA